MVQVCASGVDALFLQMEVRCKGVVECLSFVRMYAVVFSTAAGSGQLVLTNLSQMAQAIGYSSQSEALLCNFSFCSWC